MTPLSPGIGIGIPFFKDGLIAGAGGGTASGEVGELDGAFYGFTDFSEYSVASGLPAGMTAIDDGNPSYAIANDPTEGNYLAITPNSFSNFAVQIDDFSGISGFGNSIELLARVYVPAAVQNRRTLGPAYFIGGTNNADISFGSFSNYYRTLGSDYEATAIRVTNGAAGVVLQNDWPFAEADDFWGWVRLRMSHEESAPNTHDWDITWWDGDIGDEPAILSSSNGTFEADITESGMGVAITALVRNATHRISYLAFTSDWNVIAPPTP